MLEERTDGDLRYLFSPALLDGYGVSVSFTGRRGGVSTGPFEGLNLSFNTLDLRDHVVENRSRLSSSLGVEPGSWVTCRQVHGSCVYTAGPLEKGRGASDHMSALPRSDGLVTAEPGLVLAILTADCMPVALVARGAAGIAHVGWRGALYGIHLATLRKLCRLAREEPSSIRAVLGPRIGPRCFEVGPPVAGRFARVFGKDVVCRIKDRLFVDLGKACSLQLSGSGIPESNITDCGACTVCDHGYFSHRRSGGNTGRQAGLVSLVAEG